YYITVALPELTIPSALRAIGTPYRLHLVSFKRESEFILMHYYIARKGNGKIITKCPFCDIGSILPLQYFLKSSGYLFPLFRMIQTIVQDFENEPVPFFAILTHQSAQVFHRRSFQWLKAVEFKDAPD